jgi:uncharacterized protein YhdP
MFLDAITSTSLQTLAADALLAEGQVLLEEQTLNNENLRYTGQEFGDQQFQTRRAKFETKVNLSKKEIIEATHPHSKIVQFQLHKSNRITVMDLRQETIKTGPQTSAGCVPACWHQLT